MELLEKTRQINKQLQKNEKLDFFAIAELLCELIKANAYVVTDKGELRGFALTEKFKCPIMQEDVLDKCIFPDNYVASIMNIKETTSNVLHNDVSCFFKKEQACLFNNKKTTIIPIYGSGERLGTLIIAKGDEAFTDEDLLLAEYAATVIGFEFLHERAARIQEETRKRVMIQIAFSTLSYSELEAIINILNELDGDEGLLIASKIADRVGITRSVIVNALRKFESADLIETKSLGMKGTYIKIKNEYLLDELHKK